jgi:SAM-dependent methyltransferase
MSHPAAGTIIDLYRRHAATFDRLRGKSLFFERAWLDRFCALAEPGAALLDIGCGSGEPIARHLIARRHPVTGVDSSSEMIALSRARFPDQTWIVADMRGLALGQRFGGVLAWHSFFHLAADAQRAMFPIFAAHALPGAPLMFTSGTAAGEAIGEFEGEPLHHASLDPEDYRGLLDAHGFDVVDHVSEDATCGDATIWLARRRA